MFGVVVAAAGCGGRTIHLPTEDDVDDAPVAAPIDSAGPIPVPPMDKVVAWLGGWCGLARDTADLVCGSAGQVSELRTGPFLDLDSSNVPEWPYLCLVLGDGQLQCEGAQLSPPAGTFSRVSVGQYAACALGETGPMCWSMPGGPPIAIAEHAEQASGELSVQGANVCWGEEQSFDCVGANGEHWLPAEGRYLAATATRDGACAAIFPPSDAAELGVDAATDTLLRTAQIACFSAAGAESKLVGLFGLFDVDADGDGCGYESLSNGPRCWGKFAWALPTVPKTSYLQVTVSAGEVCWLGFDGGVDCTRPAL